MNIHRSHLYIIHSCDLILSCSDITKYLLAYLTLQLHYKIIHYIIHLHSVEFFKTHLCHLCLFMDECHFLFYTCTIGCCSVVHKSKGYCFDKDLWSFCQLRTGRWLLLTDDVSLCWGEASESDSVRCVQCKMCDVTVKDPVCEWV